MGEILLADLLRLGVGLGVVVAIGQAETACRGEGDDLRRVGKVLVRAEVEEDSPGSVGEMFGGDERSEFLLRLDGRDFLKSRVQWSHAQLFNGSFVHAGTEEVADLLLRRRAARGFL